MNVTISNVSTFFSNGRNVAVAALRNEAGEVIRPPTRLADQLLYAQMHNLTITNSLEVLSTVVLTLGFAA
jgi:hypothetical protein